MPNIICNPDFEFGLRCWTRDSGVVALDTQVWRGWILRLARIPAGRFLAQNLAHSVGAGNDLHFTWFSFGVAESALDVRIEYADGSTADYELRGDLFPRDSPFTLGNCHVLGDVPIESIRLENLGPSATGVTGFRLIGSGRICRCERPAFFERPPLGPPVPEDDPRDPRLTGIPRSMAYSPEDESALAERFFGIEMKLDRILDLLRGEQRPAQGKPSKKEAGGE